jgi:oligoribonuclease NrnB/cAMP/cGMP phosphodiesterase (DHH superfamily)
LSTTALTCYNFGVEQFELVLKNYEKIVTHNDFDGILCASICSAVLKVDRVIFVGPMAVSRNQVTITEKDIVCDLPYPVQCGLWFDHHEGNLQELEYRQIDIQSIPGRFDRKPSCSRVVYQYFSERMKVPPHFESAVEEADVIDGFLYGSVDEWRRETPGKVIDLSLKAHASIADRQMEFMRNLVQHLRDRSIEEVAHLGFVQKRLRQYREEEEGMIRMIRDSSLFLDQDTGREIVVVDLTPHRRRPHLIKNLAFLIYPDALAVLEIYNLMDQGVKTNNLALSMALSIVANQHDHPKNIGEIMRTLNIGDGHPGAAAGTVPCRSKQEMLRKKKEILNQIFRLWSSQTGPLSAPSKLPAPS